MNKEKHNNSKFKKTDMSITAILIIGILIVVNFFSYGIFYRFDLTENKIYSISSATKDTLGELQDIVNIDAYFSKNLPSQLLGLRQEVEDILGEYTTYSGGKIKVKFIDPGDDKSMEKDLYYMGIPQLTFQVVEKDKQQLVNGYMGLAISFGDKKEIIPAVKRDTSDLEYQLTTKIKKVTASQAAIVGFLNSQGTASLNNGLSVAAGELKNLYTLREVALDDKDPKIADDINTLIIAGPTEKFNDDQLKAINNYLMQGKPLFVMLDGVNIEQGLSASVNDTGLNELLQKYGISVDENLVADQRSGMASFSQGFFSFSTPYYFWPKIIGSGFASDYSAVSGLESVILPWSSSITLDKDKLAKTKIVDLLVTTDKSWVEKDNFQIIPNKIVKPTTGLEKHVLAVSAIGELKNAYFTEGQADTFQGKIIVIGDSDFVKDDFVKNNPDNLNLFLNLVDSLSLDDALISIRSKVATSRPIDDTKLDDAKRATLRYVNVFGVTIIVIIFGLARYYLRRRRRFVDDL